MNDPNLHECVHKLAEGILLTETTDLENLAEHHTRLLTLADGVRANGQDLLAAAALAGAEQLERIMLRDTEDPAASLDLVTRIIRFLQQVIVDGQPMEQAAMPPELAAAPSSSAPAAATAPAAPKSAAPSCATPAAPQASAKVSLEPIAFPDTVPLTGDTGLVSEFITESQEHLDSVDVNLLTIESNAADEEALNAVFRAFHTIKGVAGFLELSVIQELAHETETLLDKCRKGEMTLANAALDVVFEATDLMKALVTAVAEALSGDGSIKVHPNLGALLPRIRAVIAGQAVEASTPQGAGETAPAATTEHDADESQPDSPESAASTSAKPKTPAVSGGAAASGGAATSGGGAASGGGGGSALKETIRVDAERLDQLIDVIGEMVIAESMVSQSVEWDTGQPSTFGRMLTHLDKITRELQELAMSLRMVPVRATFQRMAKLARDVSKKLNKPIEFTIDGEETELDKNVVDAIGDPLVHMVRNSIDHGIEDTPADRAAVGKPSSGRVQLRAFHKGGSIHIEIEDDGRGLNRQRILAKALERGLIKEGEILDDSQIFNLIFEPGFSTAKTITDVSGRGVGLDVVRRNIQSLRGKVEIRSEEGKGTIFSIRLPLTLAIIEGMVIRLGDQRFIVPTLSIVRMIRPGEQDVSTVFKRSEMLKVGDRLVPLHRLDRLFRISGAVQDLRQAAVMVVEHDNRQVAFLVDELIGQQQIVIKPLGPMFRKSPGISGGAIMPDGKVGLILDVAGLTSLAGDEVPEQLAA